MKKILLPIIGALLFFPHLVFAHEVAGGGSFASGLSHPVLGFDHLLAMLSVGILSAQMGGKAIWQVPTAFVLVMLVGGVLGINGIPLFSVELGIVFSVFALGIAIAAGKKMPSFLAVGLLGVFAIFHGHAHGTEMPTLSEPMLYALGFILGTASIHITGVVIGLVAEKFNDGQSLLRYLGAGIAGIGFHLLIM